MKQHVQCYRRSLGVALFPLLFAVPLLAQEPVRVMDIPQTEIVSIASNASDVFAASYTVIHRSSDGGATWAPTSVLPTDTSDVNTILVHEGVLYAGMNGSGVFASADRGATWAPAAPGLTGVSLRITDLAVRGDSLFAGTDGGGVHVLNLETPDQWRSFNHGLPAQGITTLAVSGNALVAAGGPSGSVYVRSRQAGSWTTVAIDAEDPQNQVYDLLPIGPYLIAGTAKGIYRGTRDAAEWTPIPDAFPRSADVVALTAYGERVFASVMHQGLTLYSSDDFGTTWTSRHQGGLPVYDLRGSHDRLWIGRGDGLWYLDLGGAPGLLHATLFAHGPYALGRGSVLATLEGSELHLMGYFSGFTAPWHQLDLYRGHPAEGGEMLKNLGFTVPEGGGYAGPVALTVTLEASELAILREGQLYLRVGTLGTNAEDASGAIVPLSLTAPVLLKSSVSTITGGALMRRGDVVAVLEGDLLRIIGFGRFERSIAQVSLRHGAIGGEGEHLAALWTNYIGGPETFVGFDRTLPLTAEQKHDLLDGGLYVEFSASGTSSRSWIYPASNQAPAASEITAPSNGAIIVIGGEPGADPLDPAMLLADVAFTPADDPDGHPVAYIWQLSRTADFLTGATGALELGVDSTQVPLTVAMAAALFDTTWTGFPSIPLQTPVTFYHRVISTDGAAYTYGPTSTLTLSRGTITTNEPTEGMPGRFVLHGNYPNPFNPSTTISFDLPAAADVRVEVFNMLGQQVLAVPAGMMTAGASRTVDLDGSTLPSGSYLYRVVTTGEIAADAATGRMMLIK